MNIKGWRKLNRAQAAQIIEWYSKGASIAGLSREYKVCRHIILKILDGVYFPGDAGFRSSYRSGENKCEA